MPNADVIRYHDTKSNVGTNLRAGQWGFATDTNQIGCKRLSDSVMVWFDSSSATGYLKIDGSNSPTATIDFDGQDLDNVGDLTVNGEIDIAGDILIGDNADEGSEMFTDPSFASASEWQAAGDFAVSGGNMEFTNSTGSGNFYQSLGDQVSNMAADTWYIFRIKFGDNVQNGTIIKAQIESDFGNTPIGYPSGKSSYDYHDIYFKLQSGDTNANLVVYVSNGSGNFSISEVSLKPSSGVMDVQSYARFENGFDFGTGLGVGTEKYTPSARMISEKHASGFGDTIRLELVQSNAIFEITGKENNNFIKIESDDNYITFFDNVLEGLTPSLFIYGQRSGDSLRSLKLSVDSATDNYGYIGGGSSDFDALKIGATAINLNTTVGQKITLNTQKGIGSQSGVLEIMAGSTQNDDVRIGWGASGSLTETVYIDSEDQKLRVGGSIGVSEAMDDSSSITASGLVPHIHLEDIGTTYNTTGRVYTFENDSALFSIKRGYTSVDAQGGVPTDLTAVMTIDATSNFEFGDNDTTQIFSLSGTKSIICTNTESGTDNKSLSINGGGGQLNTRGAFLVAYGNEHATDPGYMQLSGGNVSGGHIDVYTQGLSRIHVDYDGSIGIGTDSPSDILHVYGGVSNSTIKLSRANQIGDISEWDYSGTSASIGTVSSDPFHIKTADINRVTVLNNGNIGIGETSPDEILHITDADPRIKIEDSGGGYGLVDASTGSLILSADEGSTVSDSSIILKVDGTTVATIDGSRDVVWGTDSGLQCAGISVMNNSTATTISASGTWYQFTEFDTNGPSCGATPDYTNDHITVKSAGIYQVSFSASFSGGNSTDYKIAAYKNNGATLLDGVIIERKLNSAGDIGDTGNTYHVELSANDTIELWVSNTDNTNNLTIVNCTLSITLVAGPTT